MTLRQLELFMAIVETGKFTAAARKMYVAQPSISQQIHLLEEELGEPLFVRMPNRKIQVTEAGNILREHADRVLRQVQIAKREISSLTKEPVGQIRIGMGGHQLVSMLPPAFRIFHDRFPKVSIDLVNATTPLIVDMVRNGRLDLGVVNLPLDAKDLQTKTLFTEQMVLIVKRGDALSKKRTIHPGALGSVPLALYDRTTSTRGRLDRFFEDSGIRPNVMFEVSSVETMKRLVEAGLCAAIIPASSVASAPDRKILTPLSIEGKPLTRVVGATMPMMTPLGKVVECMLTLVAEQFQKIKNGIG